MLRELARRKEGRNADPSACVIDAQSVKTSTSVLAASQGTDAGKKIVGRKRSIVTDTLGLLLAVLVTPASVQDSAAGTQLLDQVAASHPGIRKVGGDGGYETLPARSETMVHLAMTDLVARRLTGETTTSWRDPTSRDEVRIRG